MIYTNKLNLPEIFVNCVKPKEEKPLVINKFSVTELLGSTREIVLKRRFRDKIEVDVSDSIAALLGTALHEYLEKNAPEGGKTELSMELQFGKDIVSGRCDLLLNDELIDYKTTTTTKVMKNDFEDWKHQGLIYSYMALMLFDIKVKRLKFHILMKDWSKLKSVYSSSYPQSPIFTWIYEVQDSDYDYIRKYILNKLRDIHEAEINLPECTNEEKWYTGTKYAVYRKAGDKKAAAVCDSEEDAHKYISEKCNGAGEIQVRKGEYLKCKYYCDCCKFCERND